MKKEMGKKAKWFSSVKKAFSPDSNKVLCSFYTYMIHYSLGVSSLTSLMSFSEVFETQIAREPQCFDL